ncbi:Hypothetical protein HVR_LOCUS1051 [uncultured virus]|nr:Hypothetical protein HVR_LOCUS1051 [uncultured virus]
MSLEQSSNSVYGNDSIPEISEPPHLASAPDKDHTELYSSGSSIDLSSGQSEAEANKSSNESDRSHLAKTESIKSLWSTSDASWGNFSAHDEKSHKDEKHDEGHNSENCKICHDPKIIPNDVSPFAYDGRSVRYNVERGVEYRTPLILGSRKAVGNKGECGYHASHFIFDPASGTLAAGYDVDNGWVKLPNFSLITGIGNSANLDASFISGSHNKIKLENLSKLDANTDEYCLIPPSCAIVGGSHNTIANNSACQYSSTIVASHGITVQDSEATVVLGMKSNPGQGPFIGYNEATITRNLYSLGRSHVGPLLTSTLPVGTVFSTNGDVYIGGNLSVTGHINSESATFETVVAGTASFQNISSSNIVQNSIYVEGISGGTGQTGQTGITGITGPFVDITVTRGDGVNIVYANPAPGPIRIQLGTTASSTFESNRQLIIKDVSLEFGPGSSHNVYVWVPAGIRIEYYTNSVTGSTGPTYGMTASEGGIYILNTSGGSVTFRYVAPLIPGALPTWIIENQLVGNSRLLVSTGFRFIPANEGNRSLLLRRK